jgi:hypothetical protein
MRAYYHANRHLWKRTAAQEAKRNAARRAKYASDAGFRDQCKKLVKEHRVRNPGQKRRRDLERHYGLSQAQYEAMLAAQAHTCAICVRPFPKTPAVDHCHRTGRVRGLLCESCNLAIGKFRDDPELIRRAAAYLEGGGG